MTREEAVQRMRAMRTCANCRWYPGYVKCGVCSQAFEDQWEAKLEPSPKQASEE